MQIDTEFLASVGAIIGALSALMPQLLPWLKDRDNLSKNKKKIESAKLEMEFITSWMSASSQFSGEDIELKKAQAKIQWMNLLDVSAITSQQDSDSEEQEKPSAGILINLVFYTYMGLYSFLVLGSALDDDGDISPSVLLTDDNPTFLLVFFIPLAVIYYFRRRSVANKIKQLKSTQN